MNNLKKTENLMSLSSRSKCNDYAVAYENMQKVFRFKDMTEHTNHCKIINILYNLPVRKYTYLGIAAKMNISDNALRRYRADYAAWFCYYLEIERDKKRKIA